MSHLFRALILVLIMIAAGSLNSAYADDIKKTILTAPTGPQIGCQSGIIPLAKGEFSLLKPEGCEENARFVEVINRSTLCVTPVVAGLALPPVVTQTLDDGTRIPVMARTGIGPLGHESCIPACTRAYVFVEGQHTRISGRAYNVPTDIAAAQLMNVNGILAFVLGEYEFSQMGQLVARQADLIHTYGWMDNYLGQSAGKHIVFPAISGHSCTDRQ